MNMRDLQEWARLLAWSYVVFAVALLMRMFLERLHRRYRFFVSFLAVDAVSTLVPLLLPYDSRAYFWFWTASLPVAVACYFLVITELYTLVLAEYPGIAGMFRWLIRVCVPAVVLVSLIPVIPVLGLEQGATSPLLQLAAGMQRTAVLALLVFLAIVELILFWCPLRLSRNTVLYCAGYFVLFTSQTAGFSLIAQSGGSVSPAANVLMQAISCLCMLVWIVALTAEGEKRDITVGSRWAVGEKERVREQLLSFNAIIFRMVRFRRAK